MIGYDEVIEVDSHHADDVAPIAVERPATAAASRSSSRSASSRPTASSAAPPRSATRSTRCRRPNLPDTPATRERHGRFQGQRPLARPGRRAVLERARRSGLAERTLIICTTDHGLAFPGAKATLYRPRHRRDAADARSRRLHRGQGLRRAWSATSTSTRPSASSPASSSRLAAGLVPAAAGPRRGRRINDAIFAEVTFHAAYEPQRAVRTERWKYIRRFDDCPHPVLANCDDSASKELWWGQAGRIRSSPRSSSTT